MIKHSGKGAKIFDIVNTIILLILMLSCLYPLWYTFCLSISSKEAVRCRNDHFFPDWRQFKIL